MQWLAQLLVSSMVMKARKKQQYMTLGLDIRERHMDAKNILTESLSTDRNSLDDSEMEVLKSQ